MYERKLIASTAILAMFVVFDNAAGGSKLQDECAPMKFSALILREVTPMRRRCRSESRYRYVERLEDRLVLSANVTSDDIAGLNLNGELWVGESNGLTLDTAYYGDFSANAYSHVMSGDVNGDGLDDVIARRESDGVLLVARSTGDSSFVTETWSSFSTTTPWTHLLVGDFNGDGMDDVVGRAAIDGTMWVAESTGTSFANSHWGKLSTATPWLDVSVGDFNGDGMDDIVGRAAIDGTMWVAESTGGSFENSYWGRLSTITPWLDVNVGDFNGDGMDDIVGRAAIDGTMWLAESTGTSFVNSYWGRFSTSTPWQDVSVGDFNGDGMDDVIGRAESDGTWWGAISQGDSFRNSYWGRWSTATNWSDISVLDVNSDGMNDLIGRTDGGEWWTATSTGSGYTSSHAATWASAGSWSFVFVGNFNRNNVPVATDDAVKAAKNVTRVVDVLGNDRDADGDSLTIKVIGSTAGTAVVHDSGTPDPSDDTVHFTPDPNVLGPASFSYRVSDGITDSNVATVSVNVVEPIRLGANELSGPGPYYLGQQGGYYLLQSNVSTEGTAFVITAKNVTLDLNGKTITYDNSPLLAIDNHSFEQGTGAVATHWDFSGAPDADRFQGRFLSNQVYDGAYSLRFSNPASPQHVRSTNTITLEPNTTYSLSAMFQHAGTNPGVTGYVRLEGQNVGATHEANWNQTNYRGIQFVESTFTTGPNPETYRVTAGVDRAANSDFYIDDIHVQRTRVYGVAVGAFSFQPELYPGVTTFGAGDNALITNGSIVQGAGAATLAHGVFNNSAVGTEISNTNITVHGAKSVNIEAPWTTGFDVHHNNLYNNVQTIGRRDGFEGASIRFVGGDIAHNNIVGGIQAGIYVDRGPANINHNTISLNGKYTNDFGIVIWDDRGSRIHNNVIDHSGPGRSGRGIQVGGGNAGSNSSGTVVHNNTVRVQERVNNQEYGGAQLGGAYGIQIEDLSNVEVYGNTVTAIANEVDAHAFVDNGGPSGTNHYVHDNHFIGSRLGSGVEASAVRLHNLDQNSQFRFEDNELTSNSHWFGDSRTLDSIALERTVFNAVGDLAGFQAFEVQNWNRTDPNQLTIKDVRFVDNVYATPSVSQLFSEADIVNYRGGVDTFSRVVGSYTVRIHVEDTRGRPMAGANVQIADSTGGTVFTGSTDSRGNVSTTLDGFRIDGNITTSLNPHTLRVDGQVYQVIVDDAKTVTVIGG